MISTVPPWKNMPRSRGSAFANGVFKAFGTRTTGCNVELPSDAAVGSTIGGWVANLTKNSVELVCIFEGAEALGEPFHVSRLPPLSENAFPGCHWIIGTIPVHSRPRFWQLLHGSPDLSHRMWFCLHGAQPRRFLIWRGRIIGRSAQSVRACWS